MLADLPLDTADLQRWRGCARRFWLTPPPEGSGAAEDLAAAPGADQAGVPAATLRDALRASFPLGRRIAPPQHAAGWARALDETRAALADPRLQGEGGAILGACLASADGVRVCIDVLERAPQGWIVHRLRLATVGDEADIDAVALWVHVAAHAGLRVAAASLLLIDTDFVYPGLGLYAGLLRSVDLGPSLGTRPVAAWLVAMRACRRGERPPAQPGAACAQDGGCGQAAACGEAAAPAAPPAPDSLDLLGRELAAALREQGFQRVQDVPPALLTQPRLQRLQRALQRDTLELEPGVAPQIRALGWPRRYLRIDTIGFAVPVWAGTQPYQALPFQWSCSSEPSFGRVEFSVFLADDSGDPRRWFAETLLEACEEIGPVYAYNAGFERNRLRELARQFADLAPALQALADRIVDLFQLARGACYHPAMRGSWSFKAIARALAPAWQAHQFRAPGGGDSPPEAFARSLQRGLDERERQALREALQAQGRRETAVLRELVQLFEGADGGRR